jgi:hypothetical protein
MKIPLIIIIIIISGVRLNPRGTAATAGLFHQPQMTHDGDCAAIGEIKFGRGNRNTRRKPAPAPLSPPQMTLTRPGLEPRPLRWETSD